MTPRFATDASSGVVWRWEGQAFGEADAQNDVDGNGELVEINLRFPGQYFDLESETHYNYYRTYAPQLGRYIQSDPIGFVDSFNLYSYAGLNPLSEFDSLGLFYQIVVCEYLNAQAEATDARAQEAFNNDTRLAKFAYDNDVSICNEIECPEPRAECLVKARERYAERLFQEFQELDQALKNNPFRNRLIKLGCSLQSRRWR